MKGMKTANTVVEYRYRYLITKHLNRIEIQLKASTSLSNSTLFYILDCFFEKQLLNEKRLSQSEHCRSGQKFYFIQLIILIQSLLLFSDKHSVI